jgi:hypothetical protein
MIATLTHPSFFRLLSKNSLESKIQNSSDFEGFQLPQVRGKKSKNCQNSVIGFQCVAAI